jgi:hypothetical protein
MPEDRPDTTDASTDTSTDTADDGRTRLRPPNVGLEPLAKLGTHTPRRIYVPAADLPIAEGDRLRFAETDPQEMHPTHGAPLTTGRVTEIRDRGPDRLLFIERW